MKLITLTNLLLLVVLILPIIAIVLYSKIVLLSIKTPTTTKKIVLNEIDNSKPIYYCLIIISCVAALTIVINLINSLFDNMRIAKFVLFISMIIMIGVSTWGATQFALLKLDKDIGGAASMGPININSGSKVLIQTFTYLSFITAIIISYINFHIVLKSLPVNKRKQKIIKNDKK